MASASVVLYKTAPDDVFRVYQCVMLSSIPIDLWLIDNSPEPCLDPLDYPKAHYFHTGKNLGYGSGHNVALERVGRSSKFHFVINPDISFGPEVLAEIIQFLGSNPAVGQLMPAVRSEDGTLQPMCKLLPTPLNLFLRRFPFPGLGRLFTRLNDRYELRKWDHATIDDVPALSGCFMAFRLEHLRAAGLFDPRYFMYLEDYDLTRRVWQVARTVYFPVVEVTHRHAKASYKSLKMTLVHLKSAIQYFNKWGWFWDPYRRKTNSETYYRLVLRRTR